MIKTNLHCSETLSLAKYGMHRLAVGGKPMFDGAFALCSVLLVAKTSSGAVYDNRKWGAADEPSW